MTTKKPLIKATLKNLGKYYKAEGKTVEEVIDKLQQPMMRGVAVLTLEKGELKREKILTRTTVFSKNLSKTARIVAMKNIILLFSDFNK